MRIFLKISLLGFASLCLAGDSAFQAALEKAVAATGRKPFEYRAAVGISDIDGFTEFRFEGEVRFENASRFRIGFIMEGRFQEVGQEIRVVILSDGTFGWRENWGWGKLYLIEKFNAMDLINGELENLTAFISLEVILEAIPKLEAGEITRNGQVLTMTTKTNDAFVNHIPFFNNECDMVDQAIEISLHEDGGFPLILKFQAGVNHFLYIRFWDPVPISQQTMDRALAYQPPEGVKLWDQTRDQ